MKCYNKISEDKAKISKISPFRIQPHFLCEPRGRDNPYGEDLDISTVLKLGWYCLPGLRSSSRVPVPPGRTWPRSSDGTLGGQLKIQVGAEGGKMSTHAYLPPGTERGSTSFGRAPTRDLSGQVSRNRPRLYSSSLLPTSSGAPQRPMKRATQRLLDGQSQTWSSKSCF